MQSRNRDRFSATPGQCAPFGTTRNRNEFPRRRWCWVMGETCGVVLLKKGFGQDAGRPCLVESMERVLKLWAGEKKTKNRRKMIVGATFRPVLVCCCWQAPSPGSSSADQGGVPYTRAVTSR